MFRYNVEETERKHLNLENIVIFHGFDSFYEQVLDIEDWLLYPKVQAEVEETFDDLKKSLESFLSENLAAGLEVKRKKTSKVSKNDDSQHVQLINLEL